VRKLLANIVYYSGIWPKQEREKLGKIYKTIHNIDMEIKAGNIHSAYLQLMNLNVFSEFFGGN